MKASLGWLWKTKESFKTIDLDNGYFIVSFTNDDDLNYVYQEGPWMISDHYLLVQRWRPNFDSWSADYHRKIAVWIRILILPVEFFTPDALRKIGSLIGKLLKIDPNTYLSDRGRFARICIEVDLQKRLKPAIKIFRKKRLIEYEGLYLICFNCGKYGHHRESCPEAVKEVEKEKDVRDETGSQEVSKANRNVGEKEIKESRQRIVINEGEQSEGGTNEVHKRQREHDQLKGDGQGNSGEATPPRTKDYRPWMLV